MKEVLIENKQQYLIDHYPFNDPPKLADKKLCIHCDSVFTVGDYKVFKDESGDEYICCPKAPGCDGSVIDWMRVD